MDHPKDHSLFGLGLPGYMHLGKQKPYMTNKRPSDAIIADLINLYTPRKIIMEPGNTSKDEESHLPNYHFLGPMLIFGYGTNYTS